MIKKLLFFLLFSLTGITQVQIGQDIPGGELWYDTALSSYGNTVAVGAPNSGHTRVYEETSGVWTQIGQDIPVIGYSVALSSFGNIVAMGNPFSNGNGTNSGRVCVYEFDMGVWKQKRSEEHTSELQSRPHLVCRLLLEKKNSKRSPQLCH